jgi:hypothetical protein
MGGDRAVKEPPRRLDGARVLKFADISGWTPTGRTRHFRDGRQVTHFASLAIAQYESDPGFYLFYCDDDWNVVTDTYHDTIDGAVSQAEFEFGAPAFLDAGP